MAKANDLRNKLSSQSTQLGAAAGGLGAKGGGQSELSKMIQAESKRKAGSSGTGHVLNQQLGGKAGSGHGPAGGSGGAKGVPRRPSTNKGK